jgi:hypothetical protein
MLKRFRALIADGNNLAVAEPIKIPDNVWSPIAIADDANVDHILYFLCGWFESFRLSLQSRG